MPNESVTFTDEATKLTGLTMDKLEAMGAKRFADDDAEAIKNYIGTATPIAHNYFFDYKVISKAFRQLNSKSPLPHPSCEGKYGCTMRLASLFDLPSDLNSLSSHFGISYKAHNAEEDAHACLKVFEALRPPT